MAVEAAGIWAIQRVLQQHYSAAPAHQYSSRRAGPILSASPCACEFASRSSVYPSQAMNVTQSFRLQMLNLSVCMQVDTAPGTSGSRALKGRGRRRGRSVEGSSGARSVYTCNNDTQSSACCYKCEYWLALQDWALTSI